MVKSGRLKDPVKVIRRAQKKLTNYSNRDGRKRNRTTL